MCDYEGVVTLLSDVIKTGFTKAWYAPSESELGVQGYPKCCILTVSESDTAVPAKSMICLGLRPNH